MIQIGVKIGFIPVEKIALSTYTHKNIFTDITDIRAKKIPHISVRDRDLYHKDTSSPAISEGQKTRGG
jgi:hypothetical protein